MLSRWNRQWKLLGRPSRASRSIQGYSYIECPLHGLNATAMPITNEL